MENKTHKFFELWVPTEKMSREDLIQVFGKPVADLMIEERQNKITRAAEVIVAKADAVNKSITFKDK